MRRYADAPYREGARLERMRQAQVSERQERQERQEPGQEQEHGHGQQEQQEQQEHHSDSDSDSDSEGILSLPCIPGLLLLLVPALSSLPFLVLASALFLFPSHGDRYRHRHRHRGRHQR